MDPPSPDEAELDLWSLLVENSEETASVQPAIVENLLVDRIRSLSEHGRGNCELSSGATAQEQMTSLPSALGQEGKPESSPGCNESLGFEPHSVGSHGREAVFPGSGPVVSGVCAICKRSEFASLAP